MKKTPNPDDISGLKLMAARERALHEEKMKREAKKIKTLSRKLKVDEKHVSEIWDAAIKFKTGRRRQ